MQGYLTYINEILFLKFVFKVLQAFVKSHKNF